MGIEPDTELQEAIRSAQKMSKDPSFLALKTVNYDGVWVNVDRKKARPIIPGDAVELRACILDGLHASALGGHLGSRKLFGLVSERFFWPKMLETVRDCAKCHICQ